MQLPQQNTFGDEANARALRNDILEPNLIADFFAEPATALLRDARSEQPRRQPPRLQNHHLAIAEQPVIEQDLRDLRRFPGARRRLKNEARLFA